MINDKTYIYTDGDGVCLDWLSGFINFCKNEGHIALHKEPERFDMCDIFPSLINPSELIDSFQKSIFYDQIEAYSDAIEAFEIAKMKGANITMITSCGESRHVINSRKRTVQRELAGLIDDIIFLPLGASKLSTLKKLPSGIFIEDQPKLALEGVAAGHLSILKSQSYNLNFSHDAVTRVNDLTFISHNL
ncbi:hypothetical protein L1267_23180 [Pseudoalteromonas sp. OFAV1]|uniref:hypothetical protein n=1 Tax=Pseudoalteromonas sp. OFAV1 TaxID=2908892 RepID=UPI001F36768F|nr:hypothetical protein [Pseudoalteromonas sp. OFAV1]MCF2903275.1 hypothetical protein [Pseudoalteromonas sp. OFAV1]